MPNFIEESIQRTNRNWILLTVFVWVALLSATWFFRGYFAGIFLGPKIMTGQDLAAIETVDNWRHFVQVETNSEEISEGAADSFSVSVDTIGWFLVESLDDGHFLLIRTKDSNPVSKGVWNGFLTKFSSQDMRMLEQANPELAGKILPFYLDEKKEPHWVAFIYLIIYFGLALWLLQKTFFLTSASDAHPIKKQLFPYGEWSHLSHQIEQELQDAKTFGRLSFTKSWLVYRGIFSLGILALKDLNWLYLVASKNTWNLVFKSRRGGIVTAGLPRKKAVQACEYAYKLFPQLALGYSRKLQKLWKQNPEAFLNQVKHGKVN